MVTTDEEIQAKEFLKRAEIRTMRKDLKALREFDALKERDKIVKIKTIEVIYLLCNLYENVFIFKPNTSRCANSEKYIICRNFKNNNKKIITNIIENFDLLINKVDTIYSLFNIQ